MGLEVIERLRFLDSLPLAGTGQREGGEKTQPFNRFQSRLGSPNFVTVLNGKIPYPVLVQHYGAECINGVVITLATGSTITLYAGVKFWNRPPRHRCSGLA